MKKSLLVLLIILLPVTASATLISYNISYTVSAENLAQPLYGDISVAVRFVQDTERDPFFQNVGGAYMVECCWLSAVGELGVVSPTDVRFWIDDPAGNVYLDFLYDAPLGPLPLASPLPEPDRLATLTQYELGELCTPMPNPTACYLGTFGTQTFSRGEFNFTAVPEPATWLLMGVGLVGLGLVARRLGTF